MNTTIKERPILFSGAMVNAILSGAKTQTRRVVKMTKDEPLTGVSWGYTCFTPENHISLRGTHASGEYGESFVRNPYGKVGDRLWVRESGWQPKEPSVRDLRDGADTWPKYVYSADGISDGERDQYKDWGWKSKPSIFMPRWASRINLEITGVRVERLHEISEADAKAEGIEPKMRWQNDVYGDTYRDAFANLWDKINGKKHPWASDPYVWVVEFRKI